MLIVVAMEPVYSEYTTSIARALKRSAICDQRVRKKPKPDNCGEKDGNDVCISVNFVFSLSKASRLRYQGGVSSRFEGVII